MKKLVLFTFSVIITAYMCASNSSPCAGILYSNGKNVVAISGVVKREVDWGPPNFGENPKTDSKFAAWILHVDIPFHIVIDSKSGPGKEISVNEIQLELSSTFSDEQIAALENKHIAVEGRLWNATTPGDVRDINLAVTTATIGHKIVSLSCE